MKIDFHILIRSSLYFDSFPWSPRGVLGRSWMDCSTGLDGVSRSLSFVRPAGTACGSLTTGRKRLFASPVRRLSSSVWSCVFGTVDDRVGVFGTVFD